MDKRPCFGRGKENLMKKVDMTKRFADLGVDVRDGIES